LYDNYGDQGNQGNQGGYGDQPTQGYPTQGYPGQGSPQNQGNYGNQYGNQGNVGNQGGYPTQPGNQVNQGGYGNQGQGNQAQGNQGGYGNQYGNQGQSPNLYSNNQVPKRRHTGRRIVISLVVVLALLVALDFGAKAFAEGEAASQIQKHGFPKKPSVVIAGFPFLTQVISRHFDQITISSSDIPEGPVKITKLNVVADNVRLNSSFNGGTVGPLHGTLLISLGAIGDALSVAGPLTSFLGGGSKGLKITSVGNNELKGSLKLAGGILNASAVWKVQKAGPHKINLHLVSSSGLPSSLLKSADNISIPLNSLPVGLSLTGGLTSNSSGITAHVFAQSLSFGG
jgi:hypothetical protein